MPSFNNPFIWDDEQFVYKNVFVQEFDVGKIFTTNTIAGAGEVSSYYRPLTSLSLAVDYHFWDLNTVGYHLTNTLLHALAAVLLYLILRKLKIGEFSSLAISLIFALHPLQTQTVIYINSRGDSLYTIFAFASILSFIQLLGRKTKSFKIYNSKINLGEKFWLATSIFGYVLAILSKEIALATIGIWVLLTGWFLLTEKNHNFWKNSKVLLQDLQKFFKARKEIIWAFLLGLVVVISYLLVRNFALQLPKVASPYPPGDPYGDSLAVRLATFAKVLFVYAGLIFWPHPLYMERTTDYVLSLFSGWVLGVVILGLLFLTLGWRELKKHSRPLIYFGFGWFFCFLVPVSGVVPINGLVYEHWLYLPLVGFFLVILGLLRLLKLQKYLAPKYFLYLKYTLVMVLLVFVALIWNQSYIWSDRVRFYEHNLKFAKTSRLYNNLAMAYADTGELDKAIEAYEEALKINSSYPQIYHNIGNAYLEKNDLATAEDWFLQAIEKDPGFYQSHLQLIRMAVFVGDFDEAYRRIDSLEKEVKGSSELAVELRKEVEIIRQAQLYSLEQSQEQSQEGEEQQDEGEGEGQQEGEGGERQEPQGEQGKIDDLTHSN